MQLPKEIRWRLLAASTASAAVLLLSMFRWLIVDLLTVFLMVPLESAIWIAFWTIAVISLSCLTQWKKIGPKSLAPVALQIFTVLAVAFVPFTSIWLRVDFAMHRSTREAIVKKVDSGELSGSGGPLIQLTGQYPVVSRGGNQIVVEEHSGRRYILFYTFRGILDNYAGFLHVAPGGDPTEYSDLNEKEVSEIVRLDGDWYYVSHH